MVTLLRGAQAGDAEAFTCLYAVTNPLLVRYLRVVSDADPATLAVESWSTLLDGISACAAGDDDDWLELAVSTAREQALTAAGPGAAVAAAPAGADQMDEAVAALRACGPEVAEVLAMGVAAGLGRDSIARITGHEPTEVLALVLAAQDRLGRPLAALSAAFGAPATAAEVRDLPVVLPLFAAQAHQPLPPATPSAASPAFALLAGGASAVASAGSASAGSASAGSASAGSASAAVVRRRSPALGVSPRLARVGAGAAAWTMAVGGVAAAAALIGVAPAAFDSLFGHGGAGGQGIVAAHGSIRPGGLPSPTPGAPGTTAPGSGQQTGQTGRTGGRGQLAQPGRQAGPQGAGATGTGTSETTGTPTISDALVSTSTVGLSNATQVVVVSAVLTSSPPAAPGPVTAPGGIPTTPAPAPSGPPPALPSSGNAGNAGNGAGTTMVASAVKAAGTAHPKHSTGLAKGRAKAAQAAAARARAKAAAAKARAAAAAAHAKPKPKAAAAKSTA